VLAGEIWPFLPDLAARVAAAVDDFGGRLPQPQRVFPRIEDKLPGYAPVAAEERVRSEVA
jgi:hypothetical protein